MTDVDLLLTGGDVVLPGVGRTPADIAISGGKIAAILRQGALEVRARETVDVSGRVVLPGAVDAHVHLGQDLQRPRTPDEVSKETASAAAGGVTSMLAYLMGPQPYEELYVPARELMDRHSYTDYGFHFCLVTPEQVTEVPRYISEFGVSSFKFFINFRGQEGAYLGLPGNDDGFLYEVLRTTAEHGAMANPHAENIELIWKIRAETTQEADAGLDAWDRMRPDYVEAEAEHKVGYLSSVVGASMYAVHVSSAAALGALRQQRNTYRDIFIETCPHYLTLDHHSEVGARGKVNPPLRTVADQEALWDAVADGTVDVIGSDHVPRHFSAKDKDLWTASAGFPGTGTMLPLLVTEGHLKRGIPLDRIVELTATRPAQLFGLYPRKGAIAPGADADLVVLDLDAQERVTAETQHSGAEYSVWEGWTSRCKVEHTIVRGRFALRDGALGEQHGEYLPRANSGRAALDSGVVVTTRTNRPWAEVISEADESRYVAAGFGNPIGMGTRPGLLIIDVQYRTTGNSPKPFFESLEDYRTSCGDTGWDAVPHIARLLQEFRAQGRPVFYPYVAPKESFDGGRLGAKVPAIMNIDAKGYEFVAEVAPVAGDVLVAKKHPSAFYGTPLVSYLIDAQVDTLVVTGCTTSGCVRASVVDAFSHNFRVVVPQEAVYDRIPAVHQVNLFDLAQKYADVMTTSEVVDELRRIPRES